MYFQFFFGYTLRSGIAGSYGNSYLTFRVTSKLFCKAVSPFHVPTSNVREFQFLHVFANAGYFLVLLLLFLLITIAMGVK